MGLSSVPILLFCWHFAHFHLLGRLFVASLLQTSCALLVWSIGVPFEFYLDPIDWAMLGLLLPAQMAILGVLLINGFEFAEVLWRPRWQRAFSSMPTADAKALPKVSIHLACANDSNFIHSLLLSNLGIIQRRHSPNDPIFIVRSFIALIPVFQVIKNLPAIHSCDSQIP